MSIQVKENTLMKALAYTFVYMMLFLVNVTYIIECLLSARCCFNSPTQCGRDLPGNRLKQSCAAEISPLHVLRVSQKLLPAFEERHIERRRIEIDKLEHKHFESEGVFVLSLGAVHL